MAFTLPPLPYAADALAPHMSAETFGFHHAKHHKAYVDTTNALVAGSPLEGQDLVTVIRKAAGDPAHRKLASQSGQIWNHTFFWRSMTPGGGGAPTGKVAELIDASFGGYEAFAEKFKAEAVGHFASGWGWLVMEGETLKITSLHDGETPVTHPGVRPLLTVDVWEHAYYLDYQNQRAAFVQAWLDHLVNWDFANANLDGSGVEAANQPS
jgi:Fe-Mn family superoxide dismutase